MSYDLYLKPADSNASWDDFCRYFASRPHYSIQGPQIWYNNDDTGVYFVFENLAADTDPDEDGPQNSYLVLFNMNYFRPPFFGLEAEPELTAFVEHFGMSVEDPQIDGMGARGYSTERFISGWNKGNEFAYASMLTQQPAEFTLPGEELERAWRWNLGRAELQRSMGDVAFVPKVMFIACDGQLHSAIVWPDGLPTLLFPVDSVLLHRVELAPRRWFKRPVSTDLIPWASIEGQLSQHFTQKGDYWTPDYRNRPATLEDFIRKFRSEPRDMVQIDPDRILDRSLVEKHTA